MTVSDASRVPTLPKDSMHRNTN